MEMKKIGPRGVGACSKFYYVDPPLRVNIKFETSVLTFIKSKPKCANKNLYYRSPMKSPEGNVFSQSVCLSVGGLGRHM